MEIPELLQSRLTKCKKQGLKRKPSDASPDKTEKTAKQAKTEKAAA